MKPQRSNLVFLCLSIALATQLGAGCNRGLNEETARLFLDRWQLSFNSHDLASFADLYSPEGFFRVPPMLYPVKTRDELRQRFDSIWRNLPDLRIKAVDQITAGGERIAFSWVMSFTDRKTRRPGRFVGATFMTLRSGRIVQQRTIFTRVGAPRRRLPPQ